jgi:hypothetical protein
MVDTAQKMDILSMKLRLELKNSSNGDAANKVEALLLILNS